MAEIYIPRKILLKDQELSEEQLLLEGSVLIVLAEPGAGKTELLKKLGALLGSTPVRASVFRSRQAAPSSAPLIVDAMDEVARIDRLAVHDIVVKASDLGSRAVVFAGRSSEWDSSLTELVKDSFSVEPIVVRLAPFTAEEQRQLFEAKFPGEAFEQFELEAERLELVPLFGNPEFLQLFGEAYVQSGRRFTSKKGIFAEAARRLAAETNRKVSQSQRPATDQITHLAEEIFTKLLLSGASGVSQTQGLNDSEFPYLGALVPDESRGTRYLLDTRLFKPSAETEQHEPVHRIVAEYCAANYLAGRVDAPDDTLSLRRVLAVVAPKDVVRTELRGMLGWMAAVSGESTQVTLVQIDPYAILANGDPSQLTAKAKKVLLSKLMQVAQQDPYFQRSDVWRRFNVGGFFTPDIQVDVAAILSASGVVQQLRQLVLQLIHSSGGAQQFTTELRSLALDPNTDASIRRSAYSALLGAKNYDPVPDISILRSEGSITSLELATKVVRMAGPAAVTVPVIADFMRDLATLYPARSHAREEINSSRFFINRLTDKLDHPVVEGVLDNITHDLVCTCQPKHEFLCTCRNGLSRIAGLLLDRHFSSSTPASAERLWSWLKNLHFKGHSGGDRSRAVVALADAHELRRQVQWIAATDGTSRGEADEAVRRLLAPSTHTGIRFHAGDMEALAERAFAENDVAIWGALWRPHNLFDKSHADPLRTMQRAHAKKKPTFMAERARRVARWRKVSDRDQFRIRSRRRRYEAQEAQIAEKNRNHLNENRDKIEAGEHWGWVWHFAHLYLLNPEELTKNPDYGETPVIAIRNCVPFLTPHIPTLQKLAAREGTNVAEVLLAHCLVRLRDGIPLDDLSQPLLRAAATEMTSYPGMDDAERKALEAEFERVVFAMPGEPEAFARDFIEPRLANPDDGLTYVHWLGEKPTFHYLRATLPLIWLGKYLETTLDVVSSLFDMAAEHGDRAQLNELIDARFNDPVLDSGKDTEGDKKAKNLHRYWALNAFFYNTSEFDNAWEELRHDKANFLAITRRLGLLGYDSNEKVPAFSAEMMYRVLDNFVGMWPKVPLPSSWGSESPLGEQAYRSLDRLVWRLGTDIPSRKLPVIEHMLEDGRFADFRETLLTMRAEGLRQLALENFRAPSPAEVSALLDHNGIASVEDLRALVVEQLADIQIWLKGVETDPLVTFYDNNKHVDENTGRNRVVDFLDSRMKALGLTVVIERHMASSNRCDFTVSTVIAGVQHLLVVEVKGQWHTELFTAASAQLYDRYAIHPDAAGQGIYLVFWFGDRGDSIAGKSDPSITSAEQLREAILASMSDELKAVIDVVVLDVSMPLRAPPLKGKSAPRGKGRKGLTPARTV